MRFCRFIGIFCMSMRLFLQIYCALFVVLQGSFCGSVRLYYRSIGFFCGILTALAHCACSAPMREKPLEMRMAKSATLCGTSWKNTACVLQCVAVCCSVLQCVAWCCGKTMNVGMSATLCGTLCENTTCVLQCDAVYCSVMQSAAACYSVAVCCSVLHGVAVRQ